MFYSLTLEKELELQPRFFGPRMREVLQQKLISEVRGLESRGGKELRAKTRKHFEASLTARSGRTLNPLLFF
jgi:hypothetical protein